MKALIVHIFRNPFRSLYVEVVVNFVDMKTLRKATVVRSPQINGNAGISTIYPIRAIGILQFVLS